MGRESGTQRKKNHGKALLGLDFTPLCFGTWTPLPGPVPAPPLPCPFGLSGDGAQDPVLPPKASPCERGARIHPQHEYSLSPGSNPWMGQRVSRARGVLGGPV